MKCPYCNKNYSYLADYDYLGQEFACEKCEKIFIVSKLQHGWFLKEKEATNLHNEIRLSKELPRILQYAETKIGKETARGQELVSCPAYCLESHNPHCADCEFCGGTGKVKRYQAETLVNLALNVFEIRLRLDALPSRDSSIGAEEAQEIVETWDETVISDIRDYLGKDSRVMDHARTREAFFAGMNYAERYEKKFGGK